MARQLTKETRIACVTGVRTTTASTGKWSNPITDTANYQACRFIGVFKSTAGSTGTATMAVYGGNTNSTASTNYTAISGASVTVAVCATAVDQRIGSIEVVNPLYRYLRTRIVKTTKLITSAVISELYGPSEAPVNNSTYNRQKFAATTVALSNVVTRMESTVT